MTPKERFLHSLTLLKKGNLHEGLKVAEQLSFEQFYDFVFSQKETHKRFKSIEFWNALISTRHYADFFNQPHSPKLLSDFFKQKFESSFAPLIITLAEEQTDCLIKSIRVSKVFVDDDWYNFFDEIFRNHSNLRLKNHHQCFSLVRQIEKDLWEQVERKSEYLKSITNNPIEFLNELALWNECSINYNDMRSVDLNGWAINIALEFAICNNLLNIKDVTHEMILQECFNSVQKLRSHEQGIKILPVFEWLNSIRTWINFKNNALDVYCFDFNFEVEISNEGGVSLKPISIEKFKEWQDANHKISMMFDFYKKIGTEQYEEAKVDGKTKKQKDSSIQEFEADHFNILRISADNAWLDTFLDEFIEFKKQRFSIHDLTRFFSAYSGNCYFRWTAPLSKKFLPYVNKSDLIWSQIYQNAVVNLNIQSLRHDSYNRLLHQSSNQTGDIRSSAILDLLVMNTQKNDNDGNLSNFNRFNIRSNILSKPFLRFDDHLFTFTSLIANTRPQSFLFDNILNQNKDGVFIKSQSSKFEERISQQFNEAGFNTNEGDKHFKNEETGEYGDIDALAYKNGYLFVIEAKLASFRITLEEANNELSIAFTKGASQLNKAIRYIEFDFEQIKSRLGIKENSFNELKIFPLLVSTSFESDHEQIMWCGKSFLKISWYELMQVLGNEKNPQKIIELISENSVWRVLASLPKPSFTDTKILFGSISDEYEDSSSELNDKAYEYLHHNEFRKAISIINQSINQDGNFADSYVVLGDCYAALNETIAAEKAYLMAIEKDPYFDIAYNSYACFLIENNKLEHSYQIFKKAIYLNPLDEEIRNNFRNACYLIVQFGLKSQEEVDAELKNVNDRIAQIEWVQLLAKFI